MSEPPLQPTKQSQVSSYNIDGSTNLASVAANRTDDIFSSATAGSTIPTAPYPPMISTRPHQAFRSSLQSSSPHYNLNVNNVTSVIGASTGSRIRGQQQQQQQQQQASQQGHLDEQQFEASNERNQSPDMPLSSGVNIASMDDDYEGGRSVATTAAASTAQANTTVRKGPSRTSSPRVKFCNWNVLACINCVDGERMGPSSSKPNLQGVTSANSFFPSNRSMSQQFTEAATLLNMENPSDGPSKANSTNPHNPLVSSLRTGSSAPLLNVGAAVSTAGSGNSSVVGTRRKLGPLLLELRKIRFQQRHVDAVDSSDDNDVVSLFDITTICQSRGNPSLGTSVASTCLDVWEPKEGGLPFCATGLTTGALCIHSFNTDSSNMQDEEPSWIPGLDYYTTPRNHRPATAVAWRPSSGHPGHHHVAIGLTGSSSSSSGSTPSGEHHHRHSVSGGVVGGSVSRSRGPGGVVPATAGAGVTGAVGSATMAGRQSSGDREYCCFLWDIEHQQQPMLQKDMSIGASRRTKTSTPLYKLSHQTGVASLAWLLEGGQTLAIGGQHRNMHLYDLRASTTGLGGGTPPVFTIYAHNQGVHGIEVDPSRPWHFASWSRTPGEFVKLWDARRMDSPLLSDIKILGNTGSSNYIGISTKTISRDEGTYDGLNLTSSGIPPVTAVKWSKSESGSISILLGDSTICEYETPIPIASRPTTRPTLTGITHTRQPIVDMAQYPYTRIDLELNVFGPAANAPDAGIQKKIISELFSKRVVVVQNDRSVRDVPQHHIAPLAISRRDGRLMHALGRTLWIGSSTEGPSAMERGPLDPTDPIEEDISATMMRRARCIHDLKYSMNTKSNISILAEEGDALDVPGGPILGPKKDSQLARRNQLLRLWTWIDRVEGLCSEVTKEDGWDEAGITNPWYSKGLIDSGAWKLLQLDDGMESEMQYDSESLCCMTYDSEGRRAALTSCGWAGKQDLHNVLGQCEELGEYERSAALAVWHGDIGAAVDALQRGAEFLRSQLGYDENGHPKDPRVSLNYAEMLELVSLSIAGYRGGDVESSAARVWRRACMSILQRPELSQSNNVSSRVAYLRHIIKFLISIGIDESQKEVLDDSSLSLCDRVAFACRFLPRASLKSFLEECIDYCKSVGNVEGITITGIEKQGIKILQSYVDIHADVQTAALVTSRVILPGDWSNERRITAEWLQSYRSLLNTWQMWQSRAMFDVDRAQLLRKVKQRQMETLPPSSSKQSGLFQARRPMQSRRMRAADPDVQASVPAQLDARCNYCSASLGLRRQDNHPNQWLSKMKNVLSCCPTCRKPLPRCAICMLSLGSLNPYTELTRERSRTGRSGGTDDLSSLANLPFAEWFTWCMRCKHGGHAHHLVGWFAKHEVCPVSGCSCRCSFDAMQKLQRPGLSSQIHEEKQRSSSQDDMW